MSSTNKRLGIYGATGSYDFGDYAMLINNIQDLFALEKNLTIVVFTPNVICTQKILEANLDENIISKIDVVYDGSNIFKSFWLRKILRICRKASFDLENMFFQYVWRKSLNGNSGIVNFLLPQRLNDAIQSIDILLFNGGGYLQNGWGNYNIYFAHIINLAYLYKKKIFFMANSIGPLNEQYRYIFG